MVAYTPDGTPRAALRDQAHGGHGRAGFAISASRAGRHDRDIMRQTGHRSRAVFDRYVRAPPTSGTTTPPPACL
jgi:hypothetical protein